jgi:tetratricopeptide (TPR) repeat protein
MSADFSGQYKEKTSIAISSKQGVFMVSNARRIRERKLAAACGYLELELPERALRELDEIADPETIRCEFHQMRGEALRAARRFEEALVDYSRALEEKPDDLGLLMAMAWCYKRSNQLARAISAMEQAYRAHPKEPCVLYNIACYYSLAGEKSQALSWLGRALRMDSSYRERIPQETDFDPLRNDPDFRYMTETERLSDR